jgi:hypothetical protein
MLDTHASVKVHSFGYSNTLEPIRRPSETSVVVWCQVQAERRDRHIVDLATKVDFGQ